MQETSSAKPGVFVQASRSQAVLCVVVIAFVVPCLAASFNLIGRDKSGGYFFLALSVLAMGLVAWGWLISHRSADLVGSSPDLVEGPGGKVALSPATWLTKEGAAAAASAMEMVLRRQPLPTPSGLTNERAEFEPNSHLQAAEIVRSINAEVTATQAKFSHSELAPSAFVVQPKLKE